MSTPSDRATDTEAIVPSPVTMWFIALLAMLPWFLALQHLITLPDEAARQELTDGVAWPGLLAAQVSAAVALGVAIVLVWVGARRAPSLMVGVLLALALVMG